MQLHHTSKQDDQHNQDNMQKRVFEFAKTARNYRQRQYPTRSRRVSCFVLCEPKKGREGLFQQLT